MDEELQGQDLPQPQPDSQPAPPWDYATALRLRDNGHLSDDTLSAVSQKYPDWASPTDPTPAAPAAAAPEVDPDDARRADMRKMEADRQANIAKREQEMKDKKAADAQADVDRRAEMAQKMGVPQEQTDKELADARAKAEALRAEAQKPIVQTSLNGQDKGKAIPAVQEDPGQQQRIAPDINPFGDLQAGLAGSTAGYDQMAAGIRAGAAAGVAKATEQAAQIDKNQKDDEARIQVNQGKEEARQQKLDEQMQKLQQAQADLASSKIDPDHYWANKTSGDKVMAGIGMFLGAFGGTGTNMAVKTINDAIDRDIQAQKANIDIKKSNVDAQSGLYKDMFSRFKDQRTAEDATRIAYYDNAKMKVEQIAAKYQAPEIKAKAQQLIGELEQKKIEAKQSFMQSILKNLPFMEGVNPELYDKDKRERIVPGYQNLALTPKDAEEMKALTASARDAKSDLQRLLEISNMPGKSLDPSTRAEASTIATRLIGRLKEPTFGAGARLNESEIGLLEKLSGGTADITSLDSAVQRRLSTLIDGIDKSVASQAKSRGLVNSKDRVQAEAQKRGIRTVGTK